MSLENSKNPAIIACRKAARVSANRLRRKHPGREYKVVDDVWKRGDHKVYAGSEVLMSTARHWWGGRKWVQREYFAVKYFKS